jgi:hypothetical protein
VPNHAEMCGTVASGAAYNFCLLGPLPLIFGSYGYYKSVTNISR